MRAEPWLSHARATPARLRERAIALARDAAARVDSHRDPVRSGLVHERLGRYLWVVGRNDEAAAAYREAVATLPADPPSAERARVVAAEGQLLMLNELAHDAIARCEEALAVARAVGARAEAGQALNTLGAARSGHGEHEAAEACLREALAIALDLRLPDDVGRAYVNLSDCVDQAGRTDEAARLALDGFEAGRSPGLGSGYRAMLLSEAASAGSAPGAGATPSASPARRSRCERAGSSRRSRTRPSPTSRPRAEIPPPRGTASRVRVRCSGPARPRCGTCRSIQASPSSSCQPDEQWRRETWS